MSKTHPAYTAMATAAVVHIKSFSKGASRPAIKKYIEATYGIAACSAAALRKALKTLVDNKTLIADGARFKMDKAARDAAKKPKKAPKKKATKKKATKKKTTKKKPAAKKATKKKTTKKKATKKKATKKPAKKAAKKVSDKK